MNNVFDSYKRLSSLLDLKGSVIGHYSGPEEGVKKDIFALAKKTTIKEEGTDPVEKKPFEKDVPTKAVKKPSAGKILCMY